jgi:glucan 1,3-beta-glucosidase
MNELLSFRRFRKPVLAVHMLDYRLSLVLRSLHMFDCRSSRVGEQLGPTVAAKVMASHWSSWVTEADIAPLAAAGITHVRIPVGYWIVDIQPGEPFVAGGWDFLVPVLAILKQYGIQAIIDLHGAPGSQNGADNSGRSGNGINWPTVENINRTILDLTIIAQRALAVNAQAATAGVISGIELLNEPKTSNVYCMFWCCIRGAVSK